MSAARWSSLALVLAAAPAAVAAQSPTPSDAVHAPARVVSPAEAAAAFAAQAARSAPVVVEDLNDPTYLIGKVIRCPVCQGMSIADSPSEMAQSMMKQVRAMYAEGRSREDIFAFFTNSYGDWVLLAPPTKGTNWLVWMLPPLGFLLAIMGIRSYIRWTQQVEPATAPETTADDGDAYLRMVRDEVER